MFQRTMGFGCLNGLGVGGFNELWGLGVSMYYGAWRFMI